MEFIHDSILFCIALQKKKNKLDNERCNINNANRSSLINLPTK